MGQDKRTDARDKGTIKNVVYLPIIFHGNSRMATYIRIACLKPQPQGNDNRITLVWIGPDSIQRTYTVNQTTLNRYDTAEELKAAADQFTQSNFGYVLNDIWFHKNRDGVTWAIATGASPPDVWPEDGPEP